MADGGNLMAGKRGIVFGVANSRSIAWGITKAVVGQGAEIALTYQGEALKKRVEPLAAELAADRATPEQCGVLVGAVMDMAVHGRSGDLLAYLEADVVFHRTLLAASGNEMVAALGDVVAEVLAGRTRHHLMPSRPEPDAIRLHRDVADAVRSGDPAGAGAAMREILREADAAMRAGVARAPGPRL